MGGTSGVVGRVGERVRWHRLLRSCRLDPDRLPRPVEAPGERDFIIAGCPRTGTSLVAAQLFSPPDVVVSMEPWDGLRLPPAELFRSLRGELDATGRLSRGRLDVTELRAGRVGWRRDAEEDVPVEVAPGYLLGVKWPAFWRYLDLLPEARFLICVRHPADVVASFASTGGRLSRGLEYDVAFHRRMNRRLRRVPDVRVRRALLYQLVNEQIVPHLDRPQVLVVRYERWATEPEAMMAEIESFLGVARRNPPAIPIEPRPQVPDDHLAGLVRRWCPVAADLGYEL